MHTGLPPGPAWQALAEHHREICDRHMRDLFAEDPQRTSRYAIESDYLYLDFSKNLITDETLSLLLQLAEDMKLGQAVQDMFNGTAVNASEGRPALHVLLRAGSRENVAASLGGTMMQVQAELQHLQSLEQALHQGRLKGFDDQPLDTIVNIGIGGSDLGPRLITEALGTTGRNALAVHFIANIDPVESLETLSALDPRRTLFIISSKSFATLETMHSARTARAWLQLAGCPADRLNRHFMAATANHAAALEFGVAEDRILNFWDWVGGRYSIWSTAGSSAALAIGMADFQRLLAGAHSIDRHFQRAAFNRNIPVILALLGVWYNNLFNAGARAILPYDQRLRMLPDYLCQLQMESNGKSVTRSGEPVSWQTTPVIFGGPGTIVQHSFMQSLHQGTRMIPVDFLVAETDDYDPEDGHAALYANCLAQARALMAGGHADSRVIGSGNHAVSPGNKPSNMLLYPRLSPEVLGAILALYEHVTFVQAHLWGINPFDQWGVELGKSMASDIMTELMADRPPGKDGYDSSTAELIRRYRARNHNK